VVFNGLPVFKVTRQSKLESRAMLADYTQALLGFRPDVLMTHVTRPVISKGLWRDVRVCEALATLFRQEERTGVLYLLTSAGGVRSSQDVRRMERDYGWPASHQNGFPDLVGPEQGIHEMFEAFNQRHEHLKLVLVNQFGWSHERIGERLPKDMTIAHLRQAADVEFGMATYEPFGISPLEPLGAGAICVISEVCGCDGFVRATCPEGTENVISADFTQLPESMSVDELLNMSAEIRDAVEARQAHVIAEQLMQRLAWQDSRRQTLMKQGQDLVAHMGWDQVIEKQLLPVLERIMACK